MTQLKNNNNKYERDGEKFNGWVLNILFVHQTLAWWLVCLPMVRKTWDQSQVKSYQRLKKWYLMFPCLTLSIISYSSRVKWSNSGKVVPSPTPWYSSYRKGSLWVTLDYGRQLYLYLCICQPMSLELLLYLTRLEKKKDMSLNLTKCLSVVISYSHYFFFDGPSELPKEPPTQKKQITNKWK